MISLVTTVLNDRQGCEAFLAQMAAQTRQPEEILIVDGGSRDGTWEYLQAAQTAQPDRIKVFQEVGCNVARGRNLAIAKAQFDLIVSTDVGCTWEPAWLDELVAPLLANPQLDAVMGSWQVRWQDLDSNWARVEAALHQGHQFIATPKSHASSRAIAYRKALWDKIGTYPEDLTLAADDMVFALLLHKVSDRVGCAPIPRCYWERPTTLRQFCKETRRNFFGAGEAGIWLKHGILVGGRLLTEALLLGLSLLALILQAPLAWTLVPLSLLLLLLGQRCLQLWPAFRYLQQQHLGGAWWQLIVFKYLMQYWSAIGYWYGFVNGFRQCQNCRSRLQHYQMIPDFLSQKPKIGETF